MLSQSGADDPFFIDLFVSQPENQDPQQLLDERGHKPPTLNPEPLTM